MTRWCALAFIAFCIPHGVARAAPAEGSTVAILPLEGGAELPSASRDQLQARVRESLEHGEFKIVEISPSAEGSEGCTEPACWKSLANGHDATHILRVQIAFKDPDYVAEAELIDGTTGMQVATVREQRRTAILKHLKVFGFIIRRLRFPATVKYSYPLERQGT